jgi:hypothetical protein
VFRKGKEREGREIYTGKERKYTGKEIYRKGMFLFDFGAHEIYTGKEREGYSRTYRMSIFVSLLYFEGCTS